MATAPSRELDVGIVGIGDIATKAYLPLLATWPGVRLHLATRDEQRLQEVARAFRPASTSSDIDGLLAHDLDAVLVTAATEAHPELAAAALRAGVAVHVDKPLADRAAEADRLTALAEGLDVPLTVGLNRRFAPAYRQAAARRPHLAVFTKHRPDLADAVRRVVFDDLIHVVDTLRWLLDEGEATDPARVTDGLEVTGRVVDGRLHHVAFTLRRGDRHGVGIMDRRSGTTHERLEAHGAAATTVVDDLASVADHGADAVATSRPGSWTPTLQVRGFVAMLDDFLDAVATGRPPTVSPRDALASHRVCEAVVSRLTRDQWHIVDPSQGP